MGSKVRSCEQIGFDSTLIKLDEDISEDKLIANINKLNNIINCKNFINIFYKLFIFYTFSSLS